MPSLPVKALSNSAIRTLRMCPERWRRRYLEHEYEPPSGAMTLGSTIGAAETASDHHWIAKGEPLSDKDVLDAYSDEFDLVEIAEVNWQGERPAAMKDSGAAALRAYHGRLIPQMSPPVEAEREMRIDVAHPDGSTVEFVAYPDVECEDDSVIDRKVTGQRWSPAKADNERQVDAYMAGRRAEGKPASSFAFHTMVRTKSPYAEEIPTSRTDEQLDRFLAEILGAADEIAWRVETDNWSYAPDGAWWCGEKSCGYWSSCPGGGLLRRRAAQAVAS